MVIAAILALLCAPASARAQTAGELAGSIYDQTGAPLPGVRITIRGATDREAQTSAAGDFAFQDLPEGDYEISAELSGFERARRDVRVQAGERVTVSLTLHVAIVEETFVTAEKVGERDIQTIPMAISAVSNAELGRLGTRTLGEGAALAPSVTFSQNTGFGQLTIRGIGANALYAGADPSSAMYLDGVYLARPAMEFVQFLDLDRIEVLRGPQGTLYGRNAVGGAMNLDIQAAHERLPGVRRSHSRKLRSASRQRTGQRPAQTRQSDGKSRVRAGRPGRLRPRPRPSGPSGLAATMSPRHAASCAWSSIAARICCCRRCRQSGWDSVDLQQGAGGKAGISGRQPARSPRRSSVGARLESHAALRRERASHDGADTNH